MENNDKLLLRGAGSYIIVGLALAWCLIGVYNGVGFIKAIFPGNPERVLQAHLDFLLMSALILGVSALRISLARHIRWAMVIGAFTNSGIFIVFAMAPTTDPGSEVFLPDSLANQILHYAIRTSFIITTYGFGGAAIAIIRSTLPRRQKASQWVHNGQSKVESPAS
ncbi:hypothetical protein [Microbulbifer aggregans]|uniref:hypothetical protein n=1 Tax=Microbulbifer aggregans TaxID=1769779 RepID=UPI001CFE17AD|nr:hypothetical protein [Microbulbifer aggregans]